jgi:hypothetical protein
MLPAAAQVTSVSGAPVELLVHVDAIQGFLEEYKVIEFI